MQSPDERLTAEAKRVVSLMPKWTPARDKGKIVKMRYSLPITFRLPDQKKQTLDKMACNELSRQIAGKKDNPRGLYRLMGFSYENGTADKQEHPGLFNKKGHIGFLGHGSPVKFRNIRIKEL